MMCLDVNIFHLIPLGVTELLGSVGFMSFAKFDKYSPIIAFEYFFQPHTSSSPVEL